MMVDTDIGNGTPPADPARAVNQALLHAVYDDAYGMAGEPGICDGCRQG